MQACEDLKAAGHDVAQPRERVELMPVNPGETTGVRGDHNEGLTSSGRVV